LNRFCIAEPASYIHTQTHVHALLRAHTHTHTSALVSCLHPVCHWSLSRLLDRATWRFGISSSLLKNGPLTSRVHPGVSCIIQQTFSTTSSLHLALRFSRPIISSDLPWVLSTSGGTQSAQVWGGRREEEGRVQEQHPFFLAHGFPCFVLSVFLLELQKSLGRGRIAAGSLCLFLFLRRIGMG